VKRLALGFALALSLFSSSAHAGGVLVLVDSLYTDSKDNYTGFFDLLSRSIKSGNKITIANQSCWEDATNAFGKGAHFLTCSYTLSELKDSIAPTGASPRFDYDLIVVMCTNASGGTGPGRRFAVQLSQAANRPRVPVLYISEGSDLAAGAGDDSLGVNSGHVNVSLTGSSPFATSPAGFAFPVNTYFSQRLPTSSGSLAGNYITPVLWLAFYNYTKADPDGVGGTSATASDTVCAWFYNPPIVSTRAGTANANGYGVINWESKASNVGSANFKSSQLSVVAMGMAARLAPSIFQFPAQHVALDIDDGSKRFVVPGVACVQCSYPQVADAFAGFDSLGVWKIPYTLGEETDSMATAENGSTRFANEFAAARRYKMGRFTVHNHAGTSAGGSVSDSSLTSASGGVYNDIFGKDRLAWAFGTTSTQRDHSTYSLLTGATRKLITAVGDPLLVSRHVMPPGDDYSSQLAGPGGFFLSNFDSISYAIALAGASYGHGYRVVRTQYEAPNANAQEPNSVMIGGIGRGVDYFLPNINTIGASLISPVSVSYRDLLYVPSKYLWGGTLDTVSADVYIPMRYGMNSLLGAAMGFERQIDISTASEAANTSALAHRGIAKGVIWVTHIPNWRAGIGVTANGPYSGPRPAWEMTRMINGVMEAAKWCAMQANTSTVRYFNSGPIQWVYADQITERDIR
jgi:hypothetical protein